MNEQLDERRMAEFTRLEGGINKAADLVAKTLGCSFSKGQKLAACRYPSHISLSESKELAKLVNRTISKHSRTVGAV